MARNKSKYLLDDDEYISEDEIQSTSFINEGDFLKYEYEKKMNEII